jgi:hypothetical protein
MKFTIDRAKWFRGQGSDASALLRANGQRCCLGFYAQACGLTDNQIMDKTAPNHVGLIGKDEWDNILLTNSFPNQSWMQHSKDARDLIIVNDSMHVSGADREKRITEIFSKKGIEVEFVG